jgi:hypothetical protein
MGRVIAIGLTIIIVVGILAFLALRTSKIKGDLTLKEERRQQDLLLQAARTMAAIGTGYNVDEIDIVTETTRKNIDNWLNAYKNYRKEIEGA